MGNGNRSRQKSLDDKERVPVEKGTKGVRFVRMAYVFLAAFFAICVIVQIFIAGLAIFVDPIHWSGHTLFIHLFDTLPLLLLLFSFLGRLPKRMRWQSAGLFGLIYMMYFTANIRVVFPWAATAHPVLAVVLVVMSSVMVIRAYPLAFLSEVGKGEEQK